MKKTIIYFLTFAVLCFSLIGYSTLTYNDASKSNSFKASLSDGWKNYISKFYNNDLDNTTISWFFIPNTQSRSPQVNDKLNFKLEDYDAIYLGPTSKDKKTLYLTFDEGYENGYTEQILDTLKEKNVKALFFVTSHYLKNAPEVTKRMVNEGHAIGNHTDHHPSMPSVTYSADAFNRELKDVEDRFRTLTGKEIDKFFRPPMGKYSQKSLAMTKELGYKTIFWSFAYGDYDVYSLPNPYEAKKHIISHLHDGSIILLHAICKTNATILGEVIDEARNLGYDFELLPQK